MYERLEKTAYIKHTHFSQTLLKSHIDLLIFTL